MLLSPYSYRHVAISFIFNYLWTKTECLDITDTLIEQLAEMSFYGFEKPPSI